MGDDHLVPVVIDNGTYMCKAGFAGDDGPRAVFPSKVGEPLEMKHVVGWQHKDTYVGDEARPSKNLINPPPPPFQAGVVANWDKAEKLWHHVFYNELRIAPEDHPVLLTEVPFNPKMNREKMTEIMFERFRCPALYVSMSAVLSLFAAGRTTGIVLDSGHEVTHTVPVYNSHALPASITKLPFGGRDFTNYFRQLIAERLEGIRTHVDMELTCQMKEELCFVADNFEDFMKSPTDVEYKLPDGKSITVGIERFRCPEALFQPKVCLGRDAFGVHEAIYKSIMTTQEDLRPELFTKVVLAGGNTLYVGLPSRLKNEIVRLDAKITHGVEVNAEECGKYNAWIGGALLASMPVFRNDMLISKQDYEESGPSVVNSKCV